MVSFATILLFLSAGTFCALAQADDKNKTGRWFPECGKTNPNGHSIDDTEPDKPGPFHDLTEKELKKLREFLEDDPNIQAVNSSNATLNSSYIFTADLLLPNKSEVLNFLEKRGPQPIRQAHVIMFRGDKSPPVVEELVCGPLPDVSKCELLNRANKRNPVEFSVRPHGGLELDEVKKVIGKKVDDKAGAIMLESYGAKFTGCSNKKDCLASSISHVATGLVGDIKKRLMWVTATFNLNHRSVHILDFSVLADVNDTDSSKWTIEKVWYSNQVYDSLEELVSKYNTGSIPKTKVSKPNDDENLYSSLRRRGEPLPAKPQRPPRLVEPDGKRYSVKAKKVEYMGWTFNYRLSPFTGPAIYDVTFKGDKIVYELALSEIAVINSGHAPFIQTLDEVESSRMIGSRSRALIPGAGCPETATLLRSVFMNQYGEEPAVYDSSLCLFENNNGYSLRRHLSYDIDEGAFYGGMLDSVLTLRVALAFLNDDYIIDFNFRQNGVIEVKVMSTGYIQTTFLTPDEKKYGHRVQEHLSGTVHNHMFSWKVDLDIQGTSNRYETLEVIKENRQLTAFPDRPYSQTKINATIKTSEKDAISDFKFETPKYHIVHNNEKKNKYNESRAYRIEMQGMSKHLVEENLGNDKSISWARHQMVVTNRKDEEVSSSSLYAMLDSHEPAVNFSSYYEDDEDIVDEDLVFWITGGFQHIPHSEDLPNTPTTANHLSLFLLPHNYFPECPSMASRDAIFIEHKDPKDPSKGVKIDRNGNSRDQCVVPKSTLERDLEDNPDSILESRRRNPTDF